MKTARKVIITEFGAPEKMLLVSAELPEPSAGRSAVAPKRHRI